MYWKLLAGEKSCILQKHVNTGNTQRNIMSCTREMHEEEKRLGTPDEHVYFFFSKNEDD